MRDTIGIRISPILEEIEKTLWEFEVNVAEKPEYTNNGFRAGIKIFISVILDKMWELQEKENISIKNRTEMAQKAGEDIRNLIKTYTNIDSYNLYK